MLAIAAPQAGIAAAQATTAASIQGQINYTRSNEKEADRIGLDTLSRSGFDVNAMPRFFTRMADQYRFATKPPQFLLTHPLPDSRITDSRIRAQQYPQHTVPLSPEYHLARARVIARFAGIEPAAAEDWFDRELKNASPAQAQSLNYGKALVNIDRREFAKAEALINPLLKVQPNNLFYLDAATDLDVAQKQYDSALKRLNKALESQPANRVLLINRDYVLVKAGRFKQAIGGLVKYTHRFPTDINGWSLLQEAYDSDGVRHGALAAQAEIYALQGRWPKALTITHKRANWWILAALIKPVTMHVLTNCGCRKHVTPSWNVKPNNPKQENAAPCVQKGVLMSVTITTTHAAPRADKHWHCWKSVALPPTLWPIWTPHFQRKLSKRCRLNWVSTPRAK